MEKWLTTMNSYLARVGNKTITIRCLDCRESEVYNRDEWEKGSNIYIRHACLVKNQRRGRASIITRYQPRCGESDSPCDSSSESESAANK